MLRPAALLKPVLITQLLLVPTLATAEEDGFEFGARAVAEIADGEPANDMLGLGFYGYRRLNQKWWLGGTVDFLSYDFERPASVIGLTQDPSRETIDASASATNIVVFLEQRYRRPDERSQWFWNAGLGVGLVDVDDVSGPTQGGGTFNIVTDTDTELLVRVGAGYRRSLGKFWSFQTGLNVTQHLGDWEVTDRITNNSAKISGYTSFGLHVGVAHPF